MPRSKTALTPIMEKILEYVRENYPDKEFGPFDIPRTIIHHSYSVPLNAMVKRGLLIKIDSHYKLRNR
jgi:hypothetical protein